LGQTVVFIFAFGAAVAQRDGDVRFPAPDYNCTEPNGRFPDAEQCDKYYICKKGKAEAVLCNEGLLFDYTIANREKCVLPHNVKCDKRNLIQERTPGIDPRCEAANGIFNFDDPTVCDKYLACDKGRAFEMPCPAPLKFDIKVGTCVREAELSEESRHCDEENEYLEIDGFSCPGVEAIGPQGLLQAHPIYPHPTSCRHYFTCYFGKDPHKFGCSEGNVFNSLTQQCKEPEEVAECACWYSCKAALCDDCNVDCTCPAK